MRIKLYFVTLVVIALAALTVGAQSNTFTYQGRLTDNNLAAGGTYEMQFRVFDAAVAGNQLPVGTPITLTFTVIGTNPVTVSNGAFTVQLNFGAGVFTGADRWLEISVRKPSDPPSFTLLTPRQPITSSPYAIKTINAASADSVSCNLCITDAQISGIDGAKVTGTVASAATAATAGTATTAATATNALNLGGVVANQYVQTGDARLTDARPPAPGSSNYIQNTTTQQTGSNFSIDGKGVIGGDLITNGVVGVGVPVPTEKLQVAGVINSTTGGFKFPDSTIQITAASTSINRVIRGVVTFSGTNFQVAQNFSPVIDPTKAVVMLSGGVEDVSGQSGCAPANREAVLIALDSNTITIAVEKFPNCTSLTPMRVSYQIIEYK